jgi:hypothetical protein
MEWHLQEKVVLCVSTLGTEATLEENTQVEEISTSLWREAGKIQCLQRQHVG